MHKTWLAYRQLLAPVFLLALALAITARVHSSLLTNSTYIAIVLAIYFVAVYRVVRGLVKVKLAKSTESESAITERLREKVSG